MNKCPQDSFQSFPIDVGFTLTDTTYKDARKTPLNITFQWGTRSTAPNFSYANSGEIDHVRNDSSTTLKYNGSLFTLSSVQLAAPSHNRWLTPPTLEVTKLDNMEDVIITFERDLYDVGEPDDPKLVILVNPIFRTASQNGNMPYLVNMANQVAAPVTLETMFPYISSKNYVYYTTCINGITPKDPYKNILVLLNVEGTLVSTQLMTGIRNMYNKFSEGGYPKYVPLGNYMMRSNTRTSLLHLEEGFQSGVVTPPPPPGGSVPNATPPSAYRVEKCVPFDPDTQLGSDGTVILNSNNQPTRRIETIRENRASIISSWSQPGKISLSTVEQYFIYILAGVLILFILYLLLSTFKGLFTADSPMEYVSRTNMLTTGITTVVFAFIPFCVGFALGMFIIPAKCP